MGFTFEYNKVKNSMKKLEKKLRKSQTTGEALMSETAVAALSAGSISRCCGVTGLE